MLLFLSYNSSKDLVPDQGSFEILVPDRGHIMLSFPYNFLLAFCICENKDAAQ